MFCHIDQRVAGQTDLAGLSFLVLPLSPWLPYLSAPDSLRHLRYDCLLERAEAGLVGLAAAVPFLVDRDHLVRPLEAEAESKVVAENAPPHH